VLWIWAQSLLVCRLFCVELSRKVLLKGKTQYGWPPCTNRFRSAPLYIENIINLFYKTSYLNEEVNCTEPSPLVRIPWTKYMRYRTEMKFFVLMNLLDYNEIKIWSLINYLFSTIEYCLGFKKSFTNLSHYAWTVVN
jgi:hypothetical protein